MQEANDLAVICAVEHVSQAMPYIEVLEASLYKKVEPVVIRPELSVQGVRWYVEVVVKNLNDETEATVLCRVWRADSGDMKAVRVTIA